MSRRAGFTLVEMGIVVLIIAISASIVVPRVMPMIRSQESESFRQEALSVVREARERALSTGRPVAVVVGDTLRSEYDDADTPESDEEADAPQAIRSRQLPQGTELSSVRLEGEVSDESSFRLVFFPGGDATPAVIQFDQNGRLWHLLTEGGTGRTSLREGEYVDQGETKWPAGDLEIRGGEVQPE